VTCPFCKAAPRSDWGYECGTGPDAERQRSVRCRDAEIAALRERINLLAHELESAGVERGIAVVNEGIATNENTRLRERITHLESWINSLDEVLRYNGKDGQREWCGSEVGYLYPGQRVYVGGDKP